MDLSSVFLLLLVAAVVAILADRVRVPYTVALVLVGILLGSLRVLEPPHLTKELLFAVFLPGLVFEAAFHLPPEEFRQGRFTIFALAVPGVLLALALTALIMVPAARLLGLEDVFTWRHAVVFGALIAATDPIAVVSLFRTLGAPRRLATLVEGESLLNDGTAIVFFGLALTVVAGAGMSAAGVALDFFRVVGIGAAAGFLVGFAVSRSLRLVDAPMIEMTLTTIAAYGSFLLSEKAHGSGVIATVVAGMLCGSSSARSAMKPTTRVVVESFWEYIAFVLNSLVFLLIGFQVRLADLAASWRLIAAAFLVVLLVRSAVVFLVTGLLGGTRERIPGSWRVVLTWGGLRGALSMVLALSLAADFPHRDQLIVTTFGVVLLSLLVQGLTMAPLLRLLGLAQRTPSTENSSEL